MLSDGGPTGAAELGTRAIGPRPMYDAVTTQHGSGPAGHTRVEGSVRGESTKDKAQAALGLGSGGGDEESRKPRGLVRTGSWEFAGQHESWDQAAFVSAAVRTSLSALWSELWSAVPRGPHLV